MVSVIASIVEIEQFAQFIVSGKCDGINEILEKYFDVPLNGDDTCFDVKATLQQGCWLMFSACIIYNVTAFIVMRACHKALAERGNTAPIIN